MWHMVPITSTWAVSYFVHAEMFFNRQCKHFYDIWFPLLQRWQFHLSCMSRTSIGHVSTVHVYIWRWKRCARTAICHMVPITPTWAVSSFVQARMSWTRVLHYYNVLSCLLAISFSRMNRCSSNGNVSTVHVLYTWYMYTCDHENGARSHPYDMCSRAFVHANI